MESLGWLCWTAEAQGWSREEGDSADPTAGLGRGRWEEVAVPTSPTPPSHTSSPTRVQPWPRAGIFSHHLLDTYHASGTLALFGILATALRGSRYMAIWQMEKFKFVELVCPRW